MPDGTQYLDGLETELVHNSAQADNADLPSDKRAHFARRVKEVQAEIARAESGGEWRQPPASGPTESEPDQAELVREEEAAKEAERQAAAETRAAVAAEEAAVETATAVAPENTTPKAKAKKSRKAKV